MKIILSTLLIAVLVSACTSIGTQPMDDLSIQQRLQHTWSYRDAGPDLVVEGETTYLPGGIMNVSGQYRHNKTTGIVVASGTWHVKNGYLYYTVTSSNVPGMIPKGFTSADKLVKVTDKELTYVSTADGETVTEHRIR
jgi:hypothetical protein